MLTIGALRNDLRIAGSFTARERIAARLDRVARVDLADALEAVARDLGDEQGPVYRIRRLDLRLWLLPGEMVDAQIADRWQGLIARAMHRAIAHGNRADVAVYPDQAAYLAAWACDLIAGCVADRWEYRDFAALGDLPAGPALALALGRDARWTAGAFAAIARRGLLAAAIATFTARDVAALWTSWTGTGPAAPARIDTAVIAHLRRAMPDPPIAEPGSTDGHARTALGWLIRLTTGISPMPAAAAARIALPLSHLATLITAVPELALQSIDDPMVAEKLLALPTVFSPAKSWLATANDNDPAGVALLAGIVAPNAAARPAAPAPQRLASRYAGLALLLPAIRALDLGERLGAAGRLELLVGAVTAPERSLARIDRGLHLLAGVPERHETSGDRPIDWPDAATLGIDPARLALARAQLVDSPALPALCAVIDQFAGTLRGISGSGPGYLTRQFLLSGGSLAVSDQVLRVWLRPMPLRLLLGMAGKFGDVGAFDWLGGRRMVIEVAGG